MKTADFSKITTYLDGKFLIVPVFDETSHLWGAAFTERQAFCEGAIQIPEKCSHKTAEEAINFAKPHIFESTHQA